VLILYKNRHSLATFLTIFLLHVLEIETWLFVSSSQNSDANIQLGEPSFPKDVDISLIEIHFLAFLPFLCCAYTEVAVFLFLVRNLTLPSFSAASVLCNRVEVLAIFATFLVTFGHVFTWKTSIKIMMVKVVMVLSKWLYEVYC